MEKFNYKEKPEMIPALVRNLDILTLHYFLKAETKENVELVFNCLSNEQKTELVNYPPTV